MTDRRTYEQFLSAKVNFEHSQELACEASEINPKLFPHQRDIVLWAVRGGRRAIFAAFGLGKSFMQLEIGRLVEAKAEKRFLIVAPLGVRQEFKTDARKLGTSIRFVRRIEECGPRGAFLGMKTIITDVVRENNQTYRLGWTEQCKDGSRMGFAMPEYLLLFRKPPTDSSNGYADDPVVKDKEKYSRSRWQVDAHGFARSNGNRLLSAEEFAHFPHERIFKLFREHSLTEVYDFEQHVRLGESLEGTKRLPVTFMLLQPQSWHPDVWTDITRMLTLNGAQSAAGREMHLCPMQFDLADRVIAQYTMEGETVLDPFAGLGTVPYRALKLRRKGIGIELSAKYFLDAVAYCKAAEQEAAIPDLFGCEAAAVGD